VGDRAGSSPVARIVQALIFQGLYFWCCSWCCKNIL